MSYHPGFSFEVVEFGQEYRVSYGDSFLHTFGPNPEVLSHTNRQFLDEMIEEFQSFSDLSLTTDFAIDVEGDIPIPFCLYQMYSESKNLNFIKLRKEYLPGFLFFDGVLRDVAGPERSDQLSSYKSVHTHFRTLLGKHDFETLLEAGRTAYFRSAAGISEEQIVAELGSNEVLTQSDFEKTSALALIRDQFDSLSHYEKTASIVLFAAHDNASFMTSMALVQGAITSNQYATAVLAALMLRPAFSDSDSLGEYQAIFAQVKADALTAENFLKYMASDDLELVRMLSAGESVTQEFKSSMRIASEKPVDEASLKLSILKTVAGFLNAKHGGRLMIGVRDDGSVLGIEHDKYQNTDKYLLALTNLFADALGAVALSNIDMEIRSLKSKKICVITIQPSASMVFCTYKKKNIEGEVYVRQGPSTRALKISEVLEYNKARFGE